MKPFKTYCVRFAALICAAVLLSGCASARFTSTQTVPKITRQYPVKFCIQKDVQITGPKRRLAVDQQNTDATLRQITVGLDEVAAKRYPSLFSNEPDAIPIRVALDVKISSSIGYSLLLECATLAVMGGILPLPVAETYGFWMSGCKTAHLGMEHSHRNFMNGYPSHLQHSFRFLGSH